MNTQQGSSEGLVLAVVPLRLASQRVPEKVLKDIQGEPLAVRTVRRVLEAFGGDPRVRVLAAVDAEETASCLSRSLPGLEILLTDPELPSGTDRVSVAASTFVRKNPSARVKGVINIQGDMPFVGQQGLREVADYYLSSSDEELGRIGMVTLSQPFPEDQDYTDVGAVKVITDREGRAIYFSRYPIPYSRVAVPNRKMNTSAVGALHIGVYGYTLDVLARVCGHAPIDLERAESLEQLRALWLGISILVIPTEPESNESYRGVDTPNDLKWARSFGSKARRQSKSKPGVKRVPKNQKKTNSKKRVKKRK